MGLDKSSVFNPKYCMLENITIDNIDDVSFIDLTANKYHGGTSFSSGVLPKWDLLGSRYMIKRCSFDAYGKTLTDALNEELVYKYCKALGIECAEYRTIDIKYYDAETRSNTECQATLTKMFKGELVHYRVVRSMNVLGKLNDEVIEFSELFNVQPQLNDLIFIDFLFNQQDRHAKNFGLVGNQLSPLFDSGACLYYHIPDNLLSGISLDEITKCSAFSKPYDNLLEFSLKYVHEGFSFSFESRFLKDALNHVLQCFEHKYNKERFNFIKCLIERRIDIAEEILFNVRR